MHQGQICIFSLFPSLSLSLSLTDLNMKRVHIGKFNVTKKRVAYLEHNTTTDTVVFTFEDGVTNEDIFPGTIYIANAYDSHDSCTYCSIISAGVHNNNYVIPKFYCRILAVDLVYIRNRSILAPYE